MFDFLDDFSDWVREFGAKRANTPAPETRGGNIADITNPLSELNSMTWGLVGGAMEPSIARIMRYGERFDVLDEERGGVMREHLGRTISEQFERDLETIACRFALLDG